MGNFLVRYDSRVVIYERKMFIRLATDERIGQHIMQHETPQGTKKWTHSATQKYESFLILCIYINVFNTLS